MSLTEEWWDKMIRKRKRKEAIKVAPSLTSEEKEFQSFFAEVLSKFPQKSAKAIQSSYATSRKLAENQLAKTKEQFASVFDEFLGGVDDETRRKSHSIIHAASLSAAIVAFSPIPFSDALLLVPIQLTMMARLHKLFGKTWSKSLGKSLSREFVMVGLGRSAVGNVLKFVPVVGTVTGAAINASVAVTLTEALGWVTVKMLNDGEDIFDQAMSFKGQINSLYTMLRKK